VEVCDFSNSYVTFVTPNKTNTARIQIESRCEFIDGENRSEEFFLAASCKSENTYAPKGLFKVENYDFCGVFSERDFLIIRTYVTHEPGRKSEYEVGLVKNRFQEVRLDIKKIFKVRVLDENRQIVQATLNNKRLIGRTEIAYEGKQIRAILEYPIKTINVNEERNMFQVDTGPIPFPDLTLESAQRIGGFKLAYVAFNASDFAEFVIQQPTPIGGGLFVNHYSNIKVLDAKNSIIRVSGSS